MSPDDYLKKVYGGLVGKCAGVRLGAPVEPTIWTYERIENTYGDITGYVKDYRNFAADDDVNGPLFFIRALIDHPGEVTAEKVGRAWLNYTREGIGFYWWGGYGRSTEHTAYLNLKGGIEAPASGSLETNGATIAEQIGGQIFIDSWGWVFADNPALAARNAGLAASVGHDRNGIYGGQFIAACVSAAFTSTDIHQIVDQGLALIPEDSEYTRVINAVRDFYRENPENWRDARTFLGEYFGYDRYGGVCHIIPNAGVCALALFYGEGDFSRTIEIATMCGWDTDCNAGNVGAILGVMCGPSGIPERYRRPINDFHAASSISGALNIIDLPTASRELAILGLEALGEKVPENWRPGTFSDDIVLDFSLPGSTCGIRTSSDYMAPPAPGNDFHRPGEICILLDRMVRGDTARIFYKPYYRRDDFDDERYKPTFTPLAFPGQVLRISGHLEMMSGQGIALAPYVMDAKTGETVQGSYEFPAGEADFSVEWVLPDVAFAIAEVGLLATNFNSEKYLGNLSISDFSITGLRSFSVDFSDEESEFGGLTRCSLVGGAWALEDSALHCVTRDSFQLYSGPYYSTDSIVSAELTPDIGVSHLLAFRSRGAEYGYLFGFQGENRVVFLKRDGDIQVLMETDFPWQFGTDYELEVAVSTEGGACRMTGWIDGVEVLNWLDQNPHPYGMAGLAKLSSGRTHFHKLAAVEK